MQEFEKRRLSSPLLPTKLPGFPGSSNRSCRPLTEDGFVEYSKDVTESIIKTLQSKGKEYGRENADAKAFLNMDRTASMVGLSTEHYLMTIASKHWEWLCKSVQDGTLWENRLQATSKAKDIVIYMLILLAMLSREGKREEHYEDIPGTSNRQEQ